MPRVIRRFILQKAVTDSAGTRWVEDTEPRNNMVDLINWLKVDAYRNPGHYATSKHRIIYREDYVMWRPSDLKKTLKKKRGKK